MFLIRVTRHAEIAHVQLDRAQKRNALSFAMLQQLVQTAQSIRHDKGIRAVVLSGAGEAFCAGIDLSDLNNPSHRAMAFWELIKPGQSLFQKANLIWQTLPVPVIAALHGHCLGAGMQLALAADIRIAHPDCKLSIMESRWGLVPDMGLTRSLKGLIATDLAKELTLTGRIFNADYAQQIGLVTHVSADPVAQAMQLAEEMLQRSPDALLAGKRVLDAMTHQPQRALRLEKLWQLRLILGQNSKLARLKDKKPEIAFRPRQFD